MDDKDTIVGTLDDDTALPTVKELWERIVSAIKHPLNISPLSPNKDTGLVDYIPAWRAFFIGFARINPDLAGTYFFYMVVAIKLFILFCIINWLFG